MHLMILAATPRLAASTRYRIYQYIPLLAQAGIRCTFHSFISEETYRNLYRPGKMARTLAGVLAGIGRSARTAAALHTADVVWIEREAASLGPPWLEWWAHALARRPLILDLDDAVYVERESPVYGRWLRAVKFYAKTEALIGWAAHVVCGNQTVAAYARQVRPDCPTSFVPTVVDLAQFRPRATPKPPDAPPVVGWIGSHSTAGFLKPVLPVLQALSHKHRFVFRVVGAGALPDTPGLAIESLPWSLEREIEDFQTLDVGLYPLPDTPIAAGKSGFKAIQYMAVGVPCVASPVGITADIVQPGRSGFLAGSPEEWYRYLDQLLADCALRQQMGREGRQLAEIHYDARVWGPRIQMIIEQVARENAHAGPH